MKNLDPNNLEDLEIMIEILKELDIDYQVTILFDYQLVKNLGRDFPIDIEKVVQEIKFWSQVFENYS